MGSQLPPDPYKILGVEKDATLPQIRLAHRKLVLQCHPDKVQDPKLKAIKVDEFQKVQEAYEILSDVSRRSEYDQTVKLQKLKEELNKTSASASTSTPTPASSSSKAYEYNVRTAEPRTPAYSSSYPKTTQKTPKESNVYSKPPPRSYEDLYDEPARPSVRRSKTTSRDSDRDERDRRRQQDEDDREKLRRKMEKETKRDHGDRKKSRDKEKRRGTEDKVRPGTYVEDESSEDDYRRKAERARREDAIRAEAAARAQKEREAREDREQREWELRERDRELRDREREREPAAVKDSPMGDKWKDHMVNAARYVQASRRESDIKPEVPPAPPAMPSMRRADTFAAPSSGPYNIRFEVRPPAYDNHSDDELPRRSSAARPLRRPVETPSKSKDTPKPTRRSARESPFVNTGSTSPTKPTLHKQYSEPPIVGVASGRREPSRSKTDYPREPPPPPLFTRAATFTQGMGTKEDHRDRGRGPSRMVQEPDSDTDSGSDSESPSPTPQYSHVRQPRREAPEPTGTTKTYVIGSNGRSELKNSSFRPDLRDDAYMKRNRSPSPRRTTRPPLTRNAGSSSRQVRSQSRSYHPTSAPEPAEPIVLSAQPPRSRDPSRGANRSVYPPQFNINFAPQITPDKVSFTTGTQYVNQRNTESGHHRDYPPYPTARGRESVY
ncbi:0cd44752-5bae-4981-9969-03ba99229e4e-CDS [Sclerotinia trifoliorum]|uniref:0cd44752-5bae-4981-9969-03ba99229e4e-CDS n=1 Tax=Sclerotinia trifoliorum TaxID=28548 RepID=A0A8H2VQZ0_9HELO|nr:0cd44752-5bae-4981-9969-03ba99229e4e-CDS [Sclerotinia trifoliorum]